MNINKNVAGILIAGVLLGGMSGCMTEKQQAARAESRAKITRSESEGAAPAKVPNGSQAHEGRLRSRLTRESGPP